MCYQSPSLRQRIDKTLELGYKHGSPYEYVMNSVTALCRSDDHAMPHWPQKMFTVRTAIEI